MQTDGVQIVILGDPEIYSEYAPYTDAGDVRDFIDRVNQLKRVV